MKILKAKKSLGQNFLKSELALKKIIEAGEINPQDIILEIGPGKGALTEKILEKAGKVVAVEKDLELFEFLKEKFAHHIATRSLVLVHDDILEFEIGKFWIGKYKIVANIPYNITGAILKKFLAAPNQPERMVLMVQNEVAKRIVAGNGKESILSISVKAYGEPQMVMKVSARYFTPAPKVDSAVILIKNISRNIFQNSKIDEEKFWNLVKTGFAHKRKRLAGNLKAFFTTKNELLANFGAKRAEDLALEDWVLMAKD